VKPGTLNLELTAGDDYDLVVTVVDGNQAPIDLTGRTFTAQARQFADSPDVIDFTIDTAGAASGQLTLSLAAVVTAVLKPGVWDLQQVVGGKTQTLLAGNVYVNAEVTR
jgi:hypothetical protein